MADKNTVYMSEKQKVKEEEGKKEKERERGRVFENKAKRQIGDIDKVYSRRRAFFALSES